MKPDVMWVDGKNIFLHILDDARRWNVRFIQNTCRNRACCVRANRGAGRACRARSCSAILFESGRVRQSFALWLVGPTWLGRDLLNFLEETVTHLWHRSTSNPRTVGQVQIAQKNTLARLFQYNEKPDNAIRRMRHNWYVIFPINNVTRPNSLCTEQST